MDSADEAIYFLDGLSKCFSACIYYYWTGSEEMLCRFIAYHFIASTKRGGLA